MKLTSLLGEHSHSSLVLLRRITPPTRLAMVNGVSMNSIAPSATSPISTLPCLNAASLIASAAASSINLSVSRSSIVIFVTIAFLDLRATWTGGEGDGDDSGESRKLVDHFILSPLFDHVIVFRIKRITNLPRILCSQRHPRMIQNIEPSP